jgi:hypothetical protein
VVLRDAVRRHFGPSIISIVVNAASSPANTLHGDEINHISSQGDLSNDTRAWRVPI